MKEDRVLTIFGWLLAILFVGFLVGIAPFIVYFCRVVWPQTWHDATTKTPTTTLIDSDWNCTRSVPTVVYIKAVAYPSTQCNEYQRKQ